MGHCHCHGPKSVPNSPRGTFSHVWRRRALRVWVGGATGLKGPGLLLHILAGSGRIMWPQISIVPWLTKTYTFHFPTQTVPCAFNQPPSSVLVSLLSLDSLLSFVHSFWDRMAWSTRDHLWFPPRIQLSTWLTKTFLKKKSRIILHDVKHCSSQ